MPKPKWTPRGLDLEALQEEEEQLEERLRFVRRLMSAAEAEGLKAKRRIRKRRRRVPTRLDQIVGILREHGEPMSVEAIYAKLCELQPTLKWTRRAAAFHAALRGQEEGPDRVERKGKKVYGLHSWAPIEVPTAVQEPEQAA